MSSQGDGASFMNKEFRNWKQKSKLIKHEGKHNNAHHMARQQCEDLMKQTVSFMFATKDLEYKVLLTRVIACVRFLLQQGLPFRNHDEFDNSQNQGNY